MQQATHFFVGQGSTLEHAREQAFAWVGHEVQSQASLLAFIDVFWTLMLLSALAIPLALCLRNIKLGAAPQHGH
jgi:DHA2 family multidrug resistance protein